MAPARDYKRIFDGDRGPNTGGMGSYSPVAGLDARAIAELIATVHQPIVDHMRERGTPFHGVLYGGLMLTAGGPRVIEFNARFGDPETQALLPRLRSDLLDALLRSTRPGGLRGFELDWSPQWAVTSCSRAPATPSARGSATRSAASSACAGRRGDARGTARRAGEIVTSGGRVLGVTALGDDPAGARSGGVCCGADDRVRRQAAAQRHRRGERRPRDAEPQLASSPSRPATARRWSGS
jgi:phosphoribosylamine--glycine ligase